MALCTGDPRGKGDDVIPALTGVGTRVQEGAAAARPSPDRTCVPQEPGAGSPGRKWLRLREDGRAGGEGRARVPAHGASPHGGAGAHGSRGRRRLGRPRRAVSELHVLGARPGQRLAVRRLVSQKPGKAARAPQRAACQLHAGPAEAPGLGAFLPAPRARDRASGAEVTRDADTRLPHLGGAADPPGCSQASLLGLWVPKDLASPSFPPLLQGSEGCRGGFPLIFTPVSFHS